MTVECLQGNEIRFTHGTDRLIVHLHRTLRLPEDGRTHALPPSLGHFPLKQIADYRDRVPSAWREHGGLFFPMWQREAMWLSFRTEGRPFALKVAAGKVNAVSGETWQLELRGPAPGGAVRGSARSARGSEFGSGEPAHSDARNPGAQRPDPVAQDYLVTPPQPWLDGFNSGSEKIRQFVAMPLGMGYTVEAQVTGKEDVGGIQLLAFPPKDGLLVPQPRPILRGGQFMKGGTPAYGSWSKPSLSADVNSSYPYQVGAAASYSESSTLGARAIDSFDVGRSRPKGSEMGLAQGGEMAQKIYPDPHGVDTWLVSPGQRLFVHIVNSELYEQITGEKPPRSPITAQTYAEYGYPWFRLWDREMGDVPASPTLAGVKTVGQKDQQHGFSGQQDDSPVHEGVQSAGVIAPSPGVKEGKEW